MEISVLANQLLLPVWVINSVSSNHFSLTVLYNSEGSYQSNEDETFDISCWKFQHGTRATTVIDAPGRLEMVQPRLSGMLRRLGIFSDLVYFLYLGIPDCAMLVVSPDEFDENSREQLDRHIEMGISLQTRQWIVVVNKADVGLLEERYEHIKNWTDVALGSHPHTTVLVSAMEGHNMFEPFNGMYNVSL